MPPVPGGGEERNEYLILLMSTMQKQVDQCATRESVAELARRLETFAQEINARLDEITNVRLEHLAREQKTLAQLNDKNAQEAMKKVITIQTTILLSTLAAILGVTLNFIFRFIK